MTFLFQVTISIFFSSLLYLWISVSIHLSIYPSRWTKKRSFSSVFNEAEIMKFLKLDFHEDWTQISNRMEFPSIFLEALRIFYPLKSPDDKSCKVFNFPPFIWIQLRQANINLKYMRDKDENEHLYCFERFRPGFLFTFVEFV